LPWALLRGGMDVIRLGDIIEDHCTRCHMLTDHSVVAMVGEEVKKVRCRTCNHEHDFRHGKGGQKRKPKLSAYEEVLASITAGKTSEPSSKPPEGAGAPRSRSRSLSLRTRSMPQR
jgi:hypothetical protein